MAGWHKQLAERVMFATLLSSLVSRGAFSKVHVYSKFCYNFLIADVKKKTIKTNQAFSHFLMRSIVLVFCIIKCILALLMTKFLPESNVEERFLRH